MWYNLSRKLADPFWFQKLAPRFWLKKLFHTSIKIFELKNLTDDDRITWPDINYTMDGSYASLKEIYNCFGRFPKDSDLLEKIP